jgi:hypothetical protein
MEDLVKIGYTLSDLQAAKSYIDSLGVNETDKTEYIFDYPELRPPKLIPMPSSGSTPPAIPAATPAATPGGGYNKYYQKYLKYKAKYIQLKQQLGN